MKKPFLRALFAAAYIVFVVIGDYFANHVLRIANGTLLVPMTMLSIFVFSAAVMGFLFLSEPLYLLVENRKREAIVFFLKIVGFFACFVLLFIGLLFLVSSR